MGPITAPEARQNQLAYMEENKETIEKPARDCLASIYEQIEIASKSGKNSISWSDVKYSLILLAERHENKRSNLSKIIVNELQALGYSVTSGGEAHLKISW